MQPTIPTTTEIATSVQPIATTNKSDFMTSALQMLQSNSSEIQKNSQNSMEGLSDSDLKTLLQNFKDLSTDEQHGLITYLKKLEAKEPERVERLHKFVKLGPCASDSSEKAYTSGRISPFSNREAGVNPTQEEEKKPKPPPLKKLHIDSDEDDDYSYEDVFRAASKNVKEKQMQEERSKLIEATPIDKPKDLGINLTDAKMIIANLMSQIGAANKNSSPSINLLGLSTVSTSSMTNVNTITSIAGNATTTLTTDPSKLPPNNGQNLLSNTPITNINPPGPAKAVDPNMATYPISTTTGNMNSSYGQYGYSQNRQYNSNFDEFNQYQTNPNNFGSGLMDYGMTGVSPVDYGTPTAGNMDFRPGGPEFHNSQYPGAPMGTRQQFRPGYPPFDPRQNYY